VRIKLAKDRHSLQQRGSKWQAQVTGLTNRPAQGCNGQSRTEADLKLVVVSAADHRNFAGILSDPNHVFRIHKDFHAVHIFKHHKLHVASFLPVAAALSNDKLAPPIRPTVLGIVARPARGPVEFTEKTAVAPAVPKSLGVGLTW